MTASTLPESQRNNFSKLLEQEIAREQEDAGVGPEEAFLRVALRTYGFDPDEGYHTDGALDCGLDFVFVTQEETSIFQSKSIEHDGELPLTTKLDATYLNDLRRILEVITDLDHLPKEANSVVVEALTSMRTEITRRALILAAGVVPHETGTDVLDEGPEYRVNIYFLVWPKNLHRRPTRNSPDFRGSTVSNTAG